MQGREGWLRGSTALAAAIVVLGFLGAAARPALADAVFQGTWGTDGHWVGSPIKYMFVEPPDPPGTNPHPAKAWTDDEQDVLREAFAEWDRVLCNICFEEVASGANITLRWEDGDLFTGALDGAAALAYPPTVDLGLGAEFPQN